MNLLDFEQKSVPLGAKDMSNGGKYCTILKLRGTIDITTHQLFEDILSELLEQNAKRLVLNLSGLKYISSSGTGLLVKYYQKYRNSGGNIKISHIPSHIWKVLDLIGINNMIESFNTDNDALVSFKDNESYKELSKGVYPAKFQCPSCKAVLEIDNPAKYRCQCCNTYFSADKQGRVKAFMARKTKTVEIKMSDSTDSILWLESLVKNQSHWLGFPEQEINAFCEAVKEVWQICSGGKKHPWHIFRVTLLIEDGPSESGNNGQPKLIVGITSFENLNITRELMSKSSIRENTDNIEVLPLLPTGELIKITKHKK